ncbi:class I adenylate-forming enzyme family protein [Mangrovitalea sediminis]|uniref:class I adenylate-forming enzyme family protein n=1 Tax=Mangrovitalea sediminis TaxID=1982043 RepID=UPI000BE50C57|nr:class I adenylate-forming enzyme family protein [Mangrovitalea sediminis]
MRAPDEKIQGRWASELEAELPTRIHHAVWEWVEKRPDAVALIDHKVHWRYGDLVAVIDGTQRWLVEQGLRPGDRLMVVSENGRALVALLLAASRMDVWVAVINARLAPNEIDAIRDNCQPRRILYTVEVSEDAARHAERHGAASVPAGDLGELAVGPLNAVDPLPVEADGNQVAAMIYTSGTTGQPKGVMLTHRGILFISRVSGGMRLLAPGRNVYGVLPTSHVFGLSSVAIGALANGACLHTVPRFDPVDLVDALAHREIGVVQGVPAMYARTLEYLAREGVTLEAPSLVYLSAGGAPLDLDLKRRVESVFGTTLHNGYGLTEASPTVSQTRIGEINETVTVGKVLPGLEYRLILPMSRQEVLRGEVGELWLRGPNIMKGYFRNEAATRAVLDDEGWLNTGDMGRVDVEGNLYIVGRSKELIIRSGFNVYPPDVEAVLNEHPLVTLSAVVGRPVAGNEEVVAYVQPVPGAALTEQELAEFAAQRLSAYKRPSEIIFMDNLPATATGKILKGHLRDLARQSADS